MTLLEVSQPTLLSGDLMDESSKVVVPWQRHSTCGVVLENGP